VFSALTKVELLGDGLLNILRRNFVKIPYTFLGFLMCTDMKTCGTVSGDIFQAGERLEEATK
jgi:hypothetical protein